MSYDIVDITNPAAHTESYVVGLWVQVNSDGTLTYYNPVECPEIYPKGTVPDAFF